MLLFVRIANLILMVVNIALFTLWLSLIRRDALPAGGNEATYVLSELSLQVTALGVMLGMGAIFLAGLGFFGFQVVLERAESRADRTAREVVAQRFQAMQDGDFVKYNPKSRPLPVVSEVKEEGDL